MSHDDFEQEPVPGLPAKLPEGEDILWQGSTDANAFAKDILRWRWIAAYFAILAGWRLVTGIYDGLAVGTIAMSVLFMVALGSIVLGLVFWYARSVSRSAIYTITQKRIIMRIGVAMRVTFNLPFSQIENASIANHSFDTATIALKLKEHTKISWLVLWPHVRPFRLAKPEPALRLVADRDKAVSLIQQGIVAAHGIERVGSPANVTDPGASGSKTKSKGNPSGHMDQESFA